LGNSGGPVIPRSFGILLLILLAAYLYISVRWSKRHVEAEPSRIDNDQDVEKKTQAPVAKLIVKSVVGLALVLLFSDVLIKCVKELAVQWGVGEEVIASTIVAFGTSLPELVIGMTALRRGQFEILVGNVIGADILNVLFVVGASAVAAPLPIPDLFLKLHLPVMMVILIWFRLAIFSAVRKGQFTRWHGAPLMVIYLAYLVLNYALST
jgi:cation:H+ antiporter